MIPKLALWIRHSSPFVVVTVVAIAAGIYAWKRARSQYLATLVDRYIEAIDQEQYIEAEIIANEAVCKYPNSDIAKYVAYQCAFIRHLRDGKSLEVWHPNWD